MGTLDDITCVHENDLFPRRATCLVWTYFRPFTHEDYLIALTAVTSAICADDTF